MSSLSRTYAMTPLIIKPESFMADLQQARGLSGVALCVWAYALVQAFFILVWVIYVSNPSRRN